MSDPLSTSRTARESLARGLNALQADPSVPPHLVDLAAPIAQAMGALHQLERTNQLAPHAEVALNHVRGALAQLQAAPNHPAVQSAADSVAQSLTLVHSLSRMANGPAAAAAPQPPPPQQAQPPAAQPQPPAGPPPVPQGRPATANMGAKPPVPQPQAQQPPPQPMPAPHQPHQAPPMQMQPSFPQPQPGGPPPQGRPPQGPPQGPPPGMPMGPPPGGGGGYNQPMVARDPFASPGGPPPGPPPGGAPPGGFQGRPASPSVPVPAPPRQGNMQLISADLGAHSPTNFYKGLSGNDIIDHGGLFVSTYVPPKIGTQVRLKVSLPGGYEFEANAVVKWTREQGDDAAPGFGAQFTGITPEARQLIYRYVRNREPLFHDDL